MVGFHTSSPSQVLGEVTLAEAAAIAASVGVEVPKGLFELSDEALERLQAHVERGGGGGGGGGHTSSTDSASHGGGFGAGTPGFESHVEATSLEGRLGHLVAHSLQPIVSKAACAAVIEEAEARARSLGGWTTERHENYPTTDVPVQVPSPTWGAALRRGRGIRHGPDLDPNPHPNPHPNS